MSYTPVWLENLKVILRTELPKESVENFMEKLNNSYSDKTDFAGARNLWLFRLLEEIATPAATDYKVKTIVDFVKYGLRTDWATSWALPWALSETAKVVDHVSEIHEEATETNYNEASQDYEMLGLRYIKVSADLHISYTAFAVVNYEDDIGLIVMMAARIVSDTGAEFRAACLRVGEMLVESLELLSSQEA